MSQCDSDRNDFECLRSALQVITDLENSINEQNGEYRQLEHAKDVLSIACNDVGTKGGNQRVKQAIGRTAGIAIRCGHDNLADTALEIGGEFHE